MNLRLNDYLTESPRGRVGVIVMDYFEQPRELASTVIEKNSTTGRFALGVAGVDLGS